MSDDEIREVRKVTSSERTIGVHKLHVPLIMVVGLGVSLVGMSGVAWRLISHAEAKAIHLDEQEVIRGGGVAYKQDVRAAESTFEHQMLEQHKKIRALLRKVELRCRRTSTTTVCSIDVPEEE